jgi:hypothetical protein
LNVRRVITSPFAVGVVVLALYGSWLAVARHHGHEAREFAVIGQEYIDKGSGSPAIEGLAADAKPGTGYDGQFFLFIALDPTGAPEYIDDAGYRYGRIVYPLAARAIALGRQSVIPKVLILLNVLAIAAGAVAIAGWLRRRGFSVWFALVFALYPGVFVVVLRDLSEALAYSLVALAVVTFDSTSTRRLAASSALFGIAVLTRETAALYALVWAGALLLERRDLKANWRRTAAFCAGAFAPYVGYRLFLLSWLDATGVPRRLLPTAVPFGGIAEWWPWDVDSIQQVYAVVLPGLLCLVLAAWALIRGAVDAAVVALGANALLYVVLLPEPSFDDFYASLRISTSVVLALLLAAPTLQRTLGSTRTWLWVPVVAWFTPWWMLLPTAFSPTYGW